MVSVIYLSGLWVAIRFRAVKFAGLQLRNVDEVFIVRKPNH